MKAYSDDPRQRVLASVDAKEGTHQQVAERFRVSIQWVRKILRHRRLTGSTAPKPRGGGRAPAFDPAAAARLRQAVAEDNDATLKQLAQAAGVPCGTSAVFLGRLPRPEGVRHHAKKRSRRAAEQDRPDLKAQRDAWRDAFASIDPARLVFLDESGATTAMDRTYGRAASGKRVDGPVPQGHWYMTTLTAAVRLGGVIESACQRGSRRPTPPGLCTT